MTKKVLLTVLALGAFVSVSSLAVSRVFAEDSEFTNPVISRLAEKFNLNVDDVQAVFDAVREERHQEMQNRMQGGREERLNQAVTDGVITEEQKTAIQEKQQQMFEEGESEREQHREEMEAWFTEQGIDPEALMQYGGLGFGGQKGGRGGFGPKFGEPLTQPDQE